MATAVGLVAKRAATALVFLVSMLVDGEANLVAAAGEGGEECRIVPGLPLHVQLNNGVNGWFLKLIVREHLFIDTEEPRGNMKVI